ncbi:MAG: SDR family oxidoreductase [Marinoscillum sp.]
MKVLVIGANGKIGKRLIKKLKQSPHNPVAMLRKEEQVAELNKKGIQTVLADLEGNFEHAFEGVNAVVFTAGSGGHTGADKTHLVDRLGAKKAVDMAVKHNLDRFIMVSAFGADYSSDKWPDSMRHYYEAKADADNHLMQTNLNYTIIKPGRLTDESGTNNISIGVDVGQEKGSIPRADVATVIEKIITKDNTFKNAYELVSGETSIDRALSTL